MDTSWPKRVIPRGLSGHLAKNRGVISSTSLWSASPRLIVGTINQRRLPLPSTRFVATHHRGMTTYFSAVLRLFAHATRSPFVKQNIDDDVVANSLLLSMHSNIDFDAISPYRGVHVMRDPRDTVVSSYHYHRWTREPWAHKADQHGQTYQQRLNDMSVDDGVMLELDHFLLTYEEVLERWDMSDPNILEVKFDALLGPDRHAHYRAVFEHLGYDDRDVRLGSRLMRAFGADQRTGRQAGTTREGNHIRNTQSGQWRTILSAEQRRQLESRLAPIIDKFDFQ